MRPNNLGIGGDGGAQSPPKSSGAMGVRSRPRDNFGYLLLYGIRVRIM
jgi:hypothetical protein